MLPNGRLSDSSSRDSPRGLAAESLKSAVKSWPWRTLPLPSITRTKYGTRVCPGVTAGPAETATIIAKVTSTAFLPRLQTEPALTSTAS